MKISHSKLATAVVTGYSHSGKVDRDYHAPVGSNETKKRVCRNVKKKQKRLLDKMMGED